MKIRGHSLIPGALEHIRLITNSSQSHQSPTGGAGEKGLKGNDSEHEIDETQAPEPALPFAASSRGASREIKAPSTEDKQENSSEAGTLLKTTWGG